MEWSERDDDWGQERGDEHADARAYPPAPVPAHERAWRHPSEIGHDATRAWAIAEPPVALGRGLLVATGMVGCALGVAILWLLVPAGGDAPTAEVAGPSRPPAAATRPTQPAAADRSDEQSASSSTAAVTTFASLAPTTLRPTTTPAGSPDASSAAGTLPGEDPPANTVLMAQDADDPAVAVLLGDSPFLVTTANAVGDLAQIEITFDGGTTGTATVVSVGESVAYLSSDDPTAMPVGFDQLAEPALGDMVYALGDQVVSFAFGDAAALTAAPTDALAEGTPVVDGRGALVGLCTHGDLGWDVVAVAPPPSPSGTPASTTSAPGTSTTDDGTEQPTAYLGIALGLDDSGHVTVLSVTAGSPADLAGIIAGQRIFAIDGVPLSTPVELVAAVRAHRPGDTVELTLSTSTTSVTSTTTPRDTYAGASTSTLATTSTSAAPTSTIAAPTTSVPTTSTPTTQPAASTSAVATVPATTYDLPTYTVTVVLGERAPSV